MVSINTTISGYAAKDPLVGAALAGANARSQLLSTLTPGSTGVSLQNLLASVNTHSLGNITVLPTATTGSTSDASSDLTTSDAAASTADASAASSVDNALDPNANAALAVADSQSSETGQLLASLTGLGGNFTGAA